MEASIQNMTESTNLQHITMFLERVNDYFDELYRPMIDMDI